MNSDKARSPAAEHPSIDNVHATQETETAQTGSPWPALLSLVACIVFVAGFTPTTFLNSAALSAGEAPDNGFFFTLMILVLVCPIAAFFIPLPTLVTAPFKTLLWLLFLPTVLTLPIALIIGSTAEVLHSLMWCAGMGALALMFSLAMRGGRAKARPVSILAASVLLLLGGWSVASGVVMATQAKTIAKEGPPVVVLRNGSIERLTDPGWWQLRGIHVSGPTNQGDHHPYFYFHAVLQGGTHNATHIWSTRHMRWEPVQR